MFFTPDLLARRDSGFGLLWLAATLGSKSTFRKLPKRSVMTADITQLCDLIAQPNEPLALRLSSNLMIGAARIYKVKQDIFFSDVSACVTTLKKVVNELRAGTIGEAQLQMAQPTLRSNALNLPADPKSAYMMDFDMLVVVRQWAKTTVSDDDSDYNPSAVKKQKGRSKQCAAAGDTSVQIHTLVEHHEHVLSASFDLSNMGHMGDQTFAIDAPSTQDDFGFADFFPLSDGFCLEQDFGDELARELGWQASGLHNPQVPRRVGSNEIMPIIHDDSILDKALGPDVSMLVNGDISPKSGLADQPSQGNFSCEGLQSGRDSLIMTPELGHRALNEHNKSERGIGGSKFLHRLSDITNVAPARNNTHYSRKRERRTQFVLDARTELTDDELKIARTQYILAQDFQRQEHDHKRLEREYAKKLEAKILGAPTGIEAHALIDLWRSSLKRHLDTRVTHLGDGHMNQQSRKRRRITDVEEPRSQPDENTIELVGYLEDPGVTGGANDITSDPGRFRSSEEPGQGRHVSRPLSSIGHHPPLEIGFSFVNSQEDFMLPWDNAGISSSVGDLPFPSDRKFHGLAENAIAERRSSLQSKREGSLVPSHIGSNQALLEFSPTPLGGGSQGLVEDYRFDTTSPANNSVYNEVQSIAENIVALQKNSHNFLEYAKMQLKAMSNTHEMVFDKIVPTSTSTRHVAAAGFYQCLGEKNRLVLRGCFTQFIYEQSLDRKT
ncbi:hypothetical protein AMATHDRAFT_44 [Amanita thiersii Skay4041]|uniref:Rad21/Rec8-like protein N-terminal domain-containing protein n=1 Tax=Amanita thiersii Skay4041 TaxID=703135 RepID=A0A2A9NY35_9AGAR|nr:hypothetical protein AMATHDRAFT_44 [Amanita thiersii Skay4041]